MEHQTSNIKHLTLLDKSEYFWFGWLKVAAIVCIAFGAFMAIFNQAQIFNFMNVHIENAFYSGIQIPENIAQLQGWLIGIAGASMAGWGLMMLFLIHFALRKKDKWAWNAMFYSILLWFSIDTILTIKYEASFNIVINLIFFLQFLAPLMFIRQSMNKTIYHEG